MAADDVLERAEISYVRQLERPQERISLWYRVSRHGAARNYLLPNLCYETVNTDERSAADLSALLIRARQDGVLLKLRVGGQPWKYFRE
jgi:hypothetical protein